jgi:hypothetical protein
MVVTSNTIVKKIDIEIIQTIFQWHSTYQSPNPSRSSDCHCLLRIYLLNGRARAVIIASELYSNEKNVGIYRGFGDLATEVIARWSELKSILTQITWIAHTGQFCYPLSWAESHHEDRFDLISLQFNEEGQAEDADEEIIKKEKVIELLGGANLEPAVKVLQQLQHDNNWGRGIVDDFQVEACLELEQGIILGQKRMKGLVGW